MAATYLTKTSIGAGNRRTWTWSGWIKRSGLGEQRIFNHEQSSGTSNISVLKFDSDDKILYADNAAGSNAINLNSSNMRFRDVNAWYHIVLRVDTTDATDTNRARIYVNGQDIHSELGSFSTHTLPTQNYDTFANQSGNKISIGAWANNTNQYFDGLMSHVHFADGQSYAPTVFGETDSTTGQWKIKTDGSITYGTNGFFILKDGNSVTDQSGNSNNFTVAGGTLTKTEDCPSNIFATMNPLGYAASTNWTITNGNTSKTSTPTSNAWRSAYGTIGASSGKYYWEFKVNQIESSDLNNFWVGIVDAEQMLQTSNNERFYKQGRGYGYHAKNGQKGNNDSASTYGDTWTTNDIVGIAVDLDNSKIYFSKNGTWQNSGVPTSGSTGTGAAFTLTSGYTYLPAFSQYYGNEQFSINMGNGYFGTTAISSEGTNASGNGKFEYDVPTGYTALSTKGLNL